MADLKSLTKREQEVLKLLLQGKSNQQIAMALNITDNTVETYLTSIYRKIGVSSRVEAILKLGKPPGHPEAERPGKSIIETGDDQAHNTDEAGSPENGEGMAPRTKSRRKMFGDFLRRYAWPVLVGILIGLIVGVILGYQVAAYRPTVWQGYARQGERPDRATVGQTLSMTQASAGEVFGQFGCEGAPPWNAKSGEVEYDNIWTPALKNLYLNLHYSKYSSPTTDILVYVDGEPVPRATIRPADQQDWNRFAWTGLISLGDLTEGTHSVKFYTDGQTFGVADLDQFYLTARPP